MQPDGRASIARTPDPDGDPAELVVAYCAPGLKGYAERLLESNGERVREVIEHPYMTGHTDVVLVASPLFPLSDVISWP